MQIYVLVDNRARQGFRSSWGLSILVEANGVKVLFDGDTDAETLCYNVERMGVSIEDVDFVFLSHWHRDHYGGLECLAEKAKGRRVKVYAPPGEKGVVERLGFQVEELPIASNTRVGPGMWSVGPLKAWSNFYEHGLLVVEKTARVLIVGCSHPGVSVLAREASRVAGQPLTLVVGGFHAPRKEELVKLMDYTEKVAPLHCTGELAEQLLDTLYPHRLLKLAAGDVVRL